MFPKSYNKWTYDICSSASAKALPHPEKPFPYSKPIRCTIYSYLLAISFINKALLSKNQNVLNISSNDGVVILKKPLQITCLIPILKKFFKSQSGHAENPFF